MRKQKNTHYLLTLSKKKRRKKIILSFFYKVLYLEKKKKKNCFTLLNLTKFLNYKFLKFFFKNIVLLVIIYYNSRDHACNYTKCCKNKKKRNVHLNLLRIMIICILRDSRLFACGLLPEAREIGEVCGSGRNCRYRNSR